MRRMIARAAAAAAAGEPLATAGVAGVAAGGDRWLEEGPNDGRRSALE